MFAKRLESLEEKKLHFEFIAEKNLKFMNSILSFRSEF